MRAYCVGDITDMYQKPIDYAGRLCNVAEVLNGFLEYTRS